MDTGLFKMNEVSNTTVNVEKINMDVSKISNIEHDINKNHKFFIKIQYFLT